MISRLCKLLKRAAVRFLRNELGIIRDAVDWCSHGHKKFQKGDLAGAIASYDKAVELRPDYAEAYLFRAVIKTAQGKMDLAREECEKAISANPTFAKAYNDRGLLKREEGDLEGALADFNKAIRLCPDLHQPYNNRGIILAVKGDFENALIDYNRTLLLRPNSAMAHNNRSEAKRHLGDIEGAFSASSKAIELKPDFAPAYINRGLVKQMQNNLEGAIVDFNKAIELNPKLAEAYVVRASVKAVQGNFDSAFLDCAKAIDLKPKLGGAYYLRGCLHYNQQRWTEAASDFQRQFEMPRSDYAQFRLWLSHARLGEFEKSSEQLQSYLKNRKARLFNDWPSQIGMYLIGQLSEGDFIMAAMHANEKRDLEQHCEAYFYIGSKQLLQLDRTRAIAYFKKCIATNVRNFGEYQSASAELKALGENFQI